MLKNRNDQNDLNSKIEYFERLKLKREKWNGVWDELKKYVCPQTESNKNIFDSTSIWSREQLASGLQSLLTNPSRQWFNIHLDASENENGNVQDTNLYAQIIEETILSIFNNPASNFYNQVHEFFLNLAAFGTAIFYVEEDPLLKQMLFFRNINLKECYFEENKFGFVDTIYRLFEMSVKAACNKWPESRLFDRLLEKDPSEKIEILHVVTRSNNDKVNSANNSAYDNDYTSQYIYLEERSSIAESAYSYFPFLVTRWIKEEGEAYGYAPAHHVLPDIKLLNNLRQITLKVAQKQLDPPLLVPKDGYYLPLYTAPGSVNFYRNGMADKIVPLTGMENVIPTEVEQNHCRDAIYKAFYIDIFRMQKENKEMTAMEVQVRLDEQMRMMSPMVGRIETEFLNPLIIAIYGILAKYNKVPMLEGANSQNGPQNGSQNRSSGHGAGIDIEYVSPLSKAQKSLSVNAVEQVLGFFQRSGIINLQPEIYDNINFDECFKLFMDTRGAPASVLRSEQEVLQLRQQRKIMQMQQQQQIG